MERGTRIRCCVTMGRGMEPFVKKQLEMIPVLFEVDDDFNRLRNLRCTERLFVVVGYEAIDRSWNKKQLFDKLFSLFDQSSLNSTFEIAFNYLFGNNESRNRTFRVSLKATGKWRRKINIEKLSSSIARYIKPITAFSSSVHCSAFEMCIHLTEKYIFIGIPITRQPLSQRAYLLCNALRSTVIDAMLSIANIQDGDVVMDLTCGTSSVLLQAAHEYRDGVLLVGADFSLSALQLSLKNLDHLQKSDSVEPLLELIHMNIFNDCFIYTAVDHIVSDVPFGQQHGTKNSALRTLQRVCDIFSKCGGNYGDFSPTAVLLISEEHLSSIRDMLKFPTCLKQYFPVMLGTTQAIIVLLVNQIDSESKK